MTDSENPWAGELREFVESRMNGRPVPGEKATALLQSVISSFEEVTDDHGGYWGAGAWHDGLAASQQLQERADRLADRLPGG